MSDTPVVLVDENDEGLDEDMGDIDGEHTALNNGDNEKTGLEDIEPDLPQHTAFLAYLQSPIVQLNVGLGSDSTVLSAHQLLLAKSPYFAQLLASDSASLRLLDLPDVDPSTAAAVLEYLYKNDYFPTLSGQSLEHDSSIPSPDHDGVALLRHARVYTLAKRLQLPQLAGLAHRKIHLTQSTARGEIEYARFVYRETELSDDAIRRPVAQFWATRSHVLRHEAEAEFKKMCLEFPQFGFDVLSLVLDAQEKRSARLDASSAGGTGRKRQRVSGIAA